MLDIVNFIDKISYLVLYLDMLHMLFTCASSGKITESSGLKVAAIEHGCM